MVAESGGSAFDQAGAVIPGFGPDLDIELIAGNGRSRQHEVANLLKVVVDAAIRCEMRVSCAPGHKRGPNDLLRIVDAVSLCRPCAGHVDLREARTTVEEAVGARAVVKFADDLSRVIDAVGRCRAC